MFKVWEIKDLKLARRTNPQGKFIIKNHYSKSISRGNKYVFCLYVAGKLRGVATFGTPTGKNSPGDLECKRFCLAPKAKKNVASWFMSKCIKTIKKDKLYKNLISYADPEQGHEGTMYKASNFKPIAVKKTNSQAILWNGKKHHLRAVYQKINGKYTKPGMEVQKALQNKTAKYISIAPKKLFSYSLK